MNDVGGVFLGIFLFLVRAIFVPAVLLGLLLLSVRTAVTPAKDTLAIANRLALGLGFVLCILVIIVNIFLGPFNPTSFDNTTVNVIVYVLIGGAIGIFLMLIIELLVKNRATSFFITLVSATSLIGLYYYALTAQSRDPILLVVVGMLAGGLVYGIMRPEVILALIRGTRAP